MIYEKIPLGKENNEVYADAYIADKTGDFKRGAILVIPGGGYTEICSELEGEPIAMAFMPYGYNKPKGIILGYPVITAFGPESI